MPAQLAPGLRPCLFGALALALTAALACRAETGVMDWEISQSCAPSWTSPGLVFTNARGTICPDSGTGTNSVSSGSTFSNDVAGLRVVHANGLPFTPFTIDIGEYSRTVRDPLVEFIGHKADGQIVTVDAVLDGVADGPEGAPDFQTFTFPAEFADVVRLEVPTGIRWSFDNFTYSTVIPPPLPTTQKLGASYLHAERLVTKSIHQGIFLAGEGFEFDSGFSSPSSTLLFGPAGVSGVDDTYSPFYSAATDALFFVNYTRTELNKHQAGVTTLVATPADTDATGWPMPKISEPRFAAGRLLFLGYSTSDSDSFAIFEKFGGAASAVITPTTRLPGGSPTAPAYPHAFPTDIAVNETGAFAFDTSRTDSTTQTRIYAAYSPGNLQHVVGEGDFVATGVVTDIEAFEFIPSGELRVTAKLNAAPTWLYFDISGFVRAETHPAAVAPVNAGKTVTGRTVGGVNGPRLLVTSAGEIFQEKTGRYYRVIGVDDTLGAEPISVLEFKAASSTHASRIFVEVRHASAPTSAHVWEIDLAAPVALPPLFGAPHRHEESGDLFIPLSHLTANKEYWVCESSDLQTWTDLWRIATVSPLQHLVIPSARLVAPRAFFRVEER